MSTKNEMSLKSIRLIKGVLLNNYLLVSTHCIEIFFQTHIHLFYNIYERKKKLFIKINMQKFFFKKNSISHA